MIDGIPIETLTTRGLLGLAVLFILLGRLVPIKRLDDQRADYERQLHDLRVDKDAQIVMWQAVAQTSQAQVAELMEHGRMSVGILQSFNRRAEDAEGDGA